MESYFCLATFYSTYLALEFESLLKKNNLDVDLIPIPADISASCGLSARFDKKDFAQIIEVCDKNHLEVENFYKVYKDDRSSEIIDQETI